MNIYFIADLHFGQPAPHIWKGRGFNSIEAHSEGLISKWNSVVKKDDTVYVLGDVYGGKDDQEIVGLVERLNGEIHLVCGNHDTDKRLAEIRKCSNVIEIVDEFSSISLKYKSKQLICSHYPLLTNNAKKWNVSGHFHNEFSLSDNKYVFNVSVNALSGYPISIEELYEAITL